MMIGVLQRLLQLLVIVGIVFAVWKPDVLPQPIQPFAYSLQRFFVGQELSWSGFLQTWKSRWEVAGQYIPALRGWSQSIPSSPPTITAQSIVEFTLQTLFIEPSKKWDAIKNHLSATDAAALNIQD